MGFIDSLFNQPVGDGLLRLTSGSFTVDRDGHLIVSTLPQSFPDHLIRMIGRMVLDAFRSSRELGRPLSEFVIHYASLQLRAKELRGGAIIFLAPAKSSVNKAH